MIGFFIIAAAAAALFLPLLDAAVGPGWAFSGYCAAVLCAGVVWTVARSR